VVGRVVEKKEKLANAICPGYVVLGYCGSGFQGIVHVRPGLRQAKEHDPVEALQCPSCPYAIHVNPVKDKGSNGARDNHPRIFSDLRESDLAMAG